MTIQENKQHNPKATLIGISSIVMIFAVLCLTIFSMLSLMTSDSDYTLAKKYLEKTLAYYNADAEALKIYGDIVNGRIVDAGAGVVTENKDGELTEISYAVNLDDKQKLNVKIELYDGNYTITEWYVNNVNEWVPDDNINIWDGN